MLAAIGAGALGTTLAGCSTAPGRQAAEVLRGESVRVGDGTVTTFVRTDGERVAGVELTPGVLEMDRPEHVKYVLEFPEADAVPFTWFGFDWEPGGHYPGDVYAIPHFDFHFYFEDHDVVVDIPRIALPPEEHDVLYTYPLPTDQVPARYFRTNYVFGYMGEHLYDGTAPEYNGGTFGNTFVYGHWDGRLVFMEPMISVPYFEQLRSTADPDHAQLEGVGRTDRREIATPDRFPMADRFPTAYTAAYDPEADVFRVLQHDFKAFEASGGLPPDADTSRPWETEDPEVNVVHAGEERTETGGTPDHGHASTDTPPADSADVTVAVAPGGRLVFEPARIEIDVGDTVRFDWRADYHNVVPVDQPAASTWAGEPTISDAGHTHRHTFDVPGRYHYVCQPHRGQGMVGDVVVRGG